MSCEKVFDAKRRTLKAGGIVVKKRKGSPAILLLYRGRGINDWTFPKGHLNTKEDPILGAKREIFEETGIKVKNVLQIEPYIFKKNQNGEKVFQHMFIFDYMKGSLTAENDTDFPRWIPFDAVEGYLTYLPTKDYWQKVRIDYAERFAAQYGVSC